MENPNPNPSSVDSKTRGRILRVHPSRILPVLRIWRFTYLGKPHRSRVPFTFYFCMMSISFSIPLGLLCDTLQIIQTWVQTYVKTSQVGEKLLKRC